MAENNKRYAYVTFFSGRKYLPGVWLLNSTLKDVHAKYPLVVCISEDDEEDYPELDAWGIRTISVENVDVSKDALGEEYKFYFNKTFLKLRAMGLTEFEKIVLIDCDMYVAKNIDHLFEKASMTACAAGGIVFPEWVELNSGLVVITPNKHMEERLVELIKPTFSALRKLGQNPGDQDVFNALYPDWPERKELHLTDDYNALQPFLGWICKKLPGGYKSVYIFHYIGNVKPWRPTLRHRLAIIYRCMRQRSFAELRSFIMCRKHLRKMPK